jgi:hypothetical protein
VSAANPKIYVECSEELLDQLHAAREAAHRSKKPGLSTAAVDRLILSIHNARVRALRAASKNPVEPVPPDAAPTP